MNSGTPDHRAAPTGSLGRLWVRIGAIADETPGRIAILAGAILVLWLGGAIVGTAIGAYPTFNEAVWDSIWHMIDPGALGDDENTKQRALGVFLALAGLVILAGAVLTLFEELVERALGRLGSADPAISVRDHLLVIGANSTLPAIVRRVAAGDPARRSPVVVLVPPGEGTARRGLRRQLEAEADGGDIQVVGGDLQGDGLERVCAGNAAAIVVLADETENRDASDLHVLATGATLASALPEHSRPPISLQMHKGRNVDVVWDRFSAGFDALVEDRVTAATISLCLGSPAFGELFTGVENRSSLILLEGMRGKPFGSVIDRYPDLIPIGVARGDGAAIDPLFAPEPSHLIGADERVVAFGDLDPSDGSASSAVKACGGEEVHTARADAETAADAVGVQAETETTTDTVALSFELARQRQRLLIIGWSDAATSLVTELLDPAGLEQLTVLDVERPYELPERLGPLTPAFISGHPDDPFALVRALKTAAPDRILVAATRSTDARAAFVAMRLEMLLRGGDEASGATDAGETAKAEMAATDAADRSAAASVAQGAPNRPATVVQQSSADRAEQLRIGLSNTQVISSAELTGQTVAYSATSPETLAIWEKMADPKTGGIERLRISTDGKALAGTITFATVHRHLLGEGIAPLALARDGRKLELDLDAQTAISPGDELLVVRRPHEMSPED